MLAWISLGVAAAALVWTIHRDRKQSGALADEASERKAADTREGERRDEELALLRGQLERYDQRDREQRAARLVGEARGDRPGPGGGFDYTIRVRNIGKAAAEDCYVWLAEQLPENIVAGPSTNQDELGTVTPDDPWIERTLSQGAQHGGTVRSGVICAMWKDGNGEHRDQVIGRITIRR